MRTFPVPDVLEAGSVFDALRSIGIDCERVRTIEFVPGGAYFEFVEDSVVNGSDLAVSRVFVPVVRS